MSEARVVEANLRRFECAYETYVEEPFRLGEVLIVREGPAAVLGVVADVRSGPDDPTRPLSPPSDVAGKTAGQILAERPHIRPLLRTRVTVVSCGHIEGEALRPQLPPRPPPLLALVEQATDNETVRLTDDAVFLALLVAAAECDDAVVAAAIRHASHAFGAGQREFTIRAGKELARLLKAEPARLASIIRGVAA